MWTAHAATRRQKGLVPLEDLLDQQELVLVTLGADLLGNGLVASPELRVDVLPARDREAVAHVDVGLDELGVVRDRHHHGHAAGGQDGVQVAVTQRLGGAQGALGREPPGRNANQRPV